MKQINPKEMKTTDYIYCNDCQEYVDFWKFDSIEDTGHEDCNWRYVTSEELKKLVDNCIKEGCFEQTYLGIEIKDGNI